ncbi:MAG: type II toxin-antitoxin system RelE/ParE family toxin [Candidatus Omnitrophica bacterium]|nr:type II toxin-antitoxin system RelE/ParE family toxin [Candidatus Omnitrophota bacterium]
MEYKVKFPSKTLAKKFIKILNKMTPKDFREEIKERVLLLAKNPRPYGEIKTKPPIEVYSFTAQYRLRIGNYRVLYDIDDKKKIVWVFALRKRNERTY